MTAGPRLRLGGRGWAALLALLLAFTAAEAAAVAGEAPTVDEQAHLARGLSYARTGDLRLYIGHPPLIGLWAVLPLLPDPRIQLPLDDPAWQSANWIEFPITLFWKLDNPALAMFTAGRLMIILLGVLLLAVVYRLGADLGGPAVGLAAVALAVLDPNLRAHSRLITTDIGVTLFLLLATCVWRRWRRRPAVGLSLGAGVALALALTSKYPALIWAAGLLAATVLAEGGLRRWRAWLTLALSAALTVWAVYGFEVRALAGWPFPLPFATYWDEFRWSLNDIARTPAYLLGQISRDGFYTYFPVALAVKEPVPLLALAAAGLGLAAVTHRRRWRATLWWWAPPLFFLAVAVAARINIGYRHILPLWPWLYLAGAGAAVKLARRPRWGRGAAGALGVWLAAGSLLIYPHDLTYFNELAGGPDNGSKILVDSNLDWGQDLGALVDFVKQRQIPSIYVSYFGSVPIGSVAVRQFPLPAEPLPPRPTPHWRPLFPAPGWYAISVTHLLGGAVLRDPDTFAFFRHQTPVAVLGRTIYVYQVPAETGTVAVCVNPPPGLGAEAARRIFNTAAARLILFDCDRGLPLPHGLTWYVLRGEQAARLRPALEHLGARLLFDEPHRLDPAFAFSLYRLEDPAAQAAAYPEHPAAPAATFGGRLSFLGWQYARPPTPGVPDEVETVWRLEQALPEPRSLFLHALTADGFMLAGSDGFNTPSDALRAGEALIQFHPFPDLRPPLPAGVQFQTGVYALSGAQARDQLPDGGDAVTFAP